MQQVSGVDGVRGELTWMHRMDRMGDRKPRAVNRPFGDRRWGSFGGGVRRTQDDGDEYISQGRSM